MGAIELVDDGDDAVELVIEDSCDDDDIDDDDAVVDDEAKHGG